MSTTITLNAKAYIWSGFNPNQFGTWRYVGNGVPAGFSYLTSKVESTKKASTVRWNLAIPHLATEASSCSCPGGLLGTDYVRIHADLWPGSTTADRDDVLKQIRSLVLTDDFANSFLSLTQPASN